MRIGTFRAIFAILPLLAGCSLDYQGAMGSETLSESVPEMIMEDFQHTSVRKGKPAFSLSAGRAESYEKKHETVLSSVSFTELDSAGEVLTEGSADHVVYFSDTENADISGNIQLRSVSEEATILADSLQWIDETRILSAGEDSAVIIRKDDGTEFGGKGFSGDFGTKTFVFSSDVKGTYILEEDEDDEKTETDEKE